MSNEAWKWRFKEAIDFTIGCPTCAKYLTDEATLDPTSVTKLLEKDKHDKHGAAAARIDVDFTAIALTTYAGIGDEILNKHVNPYFNDLREKELKLRHKREAELIHHFAQQLERIVRLDTDDLPVGALPALEELM